jgi:hypothetical protein
MKLILSGLSLVVSGLLASGAAHAGISDCGDINVEAEAQCEVDVSGGCNVQCTPLSFQAACEAQVDAECEFGGCEVEVDGTCAVDCQASCEGKCEVDPGSFECEGECSASCEGECSANCETHAEAECAASTEEGRASCEAEASAKCSTECSGHCEASCQGSCEGTPPSAECSGKCEASCEGECNVRVQAECQLECQTNLRASCQTELQGHCEAECEAPEGALFCNGQYVDHGGHLKKCVAALDAYLKAHVKTSGSASSECTGNECEAEAEGKVEASCAMGAGPASPVRRVGWLGAGALVLAGAMRRVSRRAAR